MTEYNGWKNHETWTVNLWLTNEQGTDAEARYIARNRPTRYDSAQDLREFVEQMVLGDEAEASLATDLVTSALGAVDWYEIVDAYREDMTLEHADFDIARMPGEPCAIPCGACEREFGA